MEIIAWIQTIDLNAAIGRCWSEVWQLVQQQSVDLLLLYVPVDYLVMPLVNGLKTIAKMTEKPQIMIVYEPANLLSEGMLGSETSPEKNDAGLERELWSILKDISTKILPNSLSKEELLQEIQQLLSYQKSAKQTVGKKPVIQS
jgi:hypothetical protein